MPELPVGRPALQDTLHRPHALPKLEQVLAPGVFAHRGLRLSGIGRCEPQSARGGLHGVARLAVRVVRVRRRSFLLGLEVVDARLKLGDFGLQRRGVLLLPLAVSFLYRALIGPRGSCLLAVVRIDVGIVGGGVHREAHRGYLVEAEGEERVSHDRVVQLVRESCTYRRGIYDEVVRATAGEGP